MPRSKKRTTHEDFIIKLNNRFPDRNYKVVGRYVHNKKRILVENEFGLCEITPEQLLKGSKPSPRSAVNKKEYTIKRFKKIHGDKYDYSKFIYLGTTTKSTIICKIHGEFLMHPNSHLSGRGCMGCKNDNTKQRESMSEEGFIRKAVSVHNNKYDYSKTKYIGCREKIVINCPEHGDFEQIPYYHLAGNGCQVCGKELGGFSRKDYIEVAKGRECTLYVIECSNEDERFIKVGITSTSIKKRFKSKSDLPYNYKVLKEVKGDAETIWNLEKKYFKNLKGYKYKPKIHFQGSSECFDTSIIKII